MGTLVYLKTFMKDRNVASITPTSPFGVKKVCGKIDFPQSRHIIEYGPATGVFTKYLLRRMRQDAKLVLIERNGLLSSILKERIHDPRVQIFTDTAENVDRIADACDIPCADVVISGIPFSFLPDETRSEILRKTHGVLRKGGKFLAYQTFYQNDDHLKVHLLRHFTSVRGDFEILNLPPMRIYEAVK
jgi:phospholipid N-methyltransferase